MTMHTVGNGMMVVAGAGMAVTSLLGSNPGFAAAGMMFVLAGLMALWLKRRENRS